jgi:hypothetical protein
MIFLLVAMNRNSTRSVSLRSRGLIYEAMFLPRFTRFPQLSFGHILDTVFKSIMICEFTIIKNKMGLG